MHGQEHTPSVLLVGEVWRLVVVAELEVGGRRCGYGCFLGGRLDGSDRVKAGRDRLTTRWLFELTGAGDVSYTPAPEAVDWISALGYLVVGSKTLETTADSPPFKGVVCELQPGCSLTVRGGLRWEGDGVLVPPTLRLSFFPFP